MATALSFLITAVDQASATLSTVSSNVTSVGSNAEKMSAVTKVALAATGVAALKFGQDSIQAYTESQESAARLQDAFDRFPAINDRTIESFQRTNEELAKKTRFDDDALASGQAVLAQFGLTGAQIEEMTPLLADYAAKTGKDIPSAAEDLGKATMGQGKALKALGIDFQDAGSASANLDQLMGGLRSQVAGFAETDGKTAAGQAEILNNQFGEIQETVGEKLVPILLRLSAGLLEVIGFVQRNSDVLIPLAAVLGVIGAVIYTIITAVKIWTAVQTAFNVVMAMNPVLLIVLAIVALIAVIVLAYQHSETFRDIVNGAFGAVLSVVQSVWQWISDNWPLLLAILTGPIGIAVLAIVKYWDEIKGGAAAAFKWVGDKFGEYVIGPIMAIKDKFSGIFDGLKDAFKTAINWIIDGWNKFGFTIGPIKIPYAPDIPRISVQTPDLQRLAQGGLSTGETDVTIGDNPSGRELVLPEEKWAAYGITKNGNRGGAGNGGGLTVNINGPVYADRIQMAMVMRDAYEEAVRQGFIPPGALGVGVQ